MACRKCDSTTTKKAGSSRTSKKVECGTDNAKSRTTSKKTSRVKNCN